MWSSLLQAEERVKKMENKKVFLPEEPLILQNGMVFPSRVIMSPMEGIMNSPLFFRTVCELSLADFWMPPFQGISPHAVPSPGALRKKYRIYLESGLPFFIQYLGHDPAAAAEAVRNAAAAGIKGVNFNFGCPSKTVLKSASGGAVLKEPRLMEKMLLAAKNAVPGMTVSIKMRIGYSSFKECKTLLNIVKNTGVDFVICHARTVEEKYSFLSKDAIKERMDMAVEEAGNIPLFGNGDICGKEMADLYFSCGCSGIGIARGLLKDPWILERLKNKSCPDVSAGRKRFLEVYKNSLSGKKGKGTYAECIRLAYGEDSEEFRNMIRENRKG